MNNFVSFIGRLVLVILFQAFIVILSVQGPHYTLTGEFQAVDLNQTGIAFFVVFSLFVSVVWQAISLD